MSKQTKKGAQKVTLEYVGKPGKMYRNLPRLKKGGTISVDEGLAASLLKTKDFKKATAASAAADKE